MTDHPVHARIDGPIVMIGFGSIGKGTLPLIERHFEYDKSRFVVIDPEDKDRKLLDDRGIRFVHQAVTRANYRKLLTPLLTAWWYRRVGKERLAAAVEAGQPEAVALER